MRSRIKYVIKLCILSMLLVSCGNNTKEDKLSKQKIQQPSVTEIPNATNTHINYIEKEDWSTEVKKLNLSTKEIADIAKKVMQNKKYKNVTVYEDEYTDETFLFYDLKEPLCYTNDSKAYYINVSPEIHIADLNEDGSIGILEMYIFPHYHSGNFLDYLFSGNIIFKSGNDKKRLKIDETSQYQAEDNSHEFITEMSIYFSCTSSNTDSDLMELTKLLNKDKVTARIDTDSKKVSMKIDNKTKKLICETSDLYFDILKELAVSHNLAVNEK